MTDKRYAVVADGVVTNILLWDGTVQVRPDALPENETWIPFPENLTGQLIEVVSDAQIGDTYVDGKFSRPPPPDPLPPSVSQVLAERAARMAQATAEIAPLQDLVGLGEADEDDEDKLLEWKQYRVAVSKVHTQPGFPESVEWPDAPAI